MNKLEMIGEARKVLGLGEEATREEIKSRYRELMKKYHPDRLPASEESLEKAKQITWAYDIISSYCDNYRFSFREEDVERMNPDLKLNKQFSDDWLVR